MLFFSKKPHLPLLIIFTTSIPDPRTPRWEFDSKWYFVVVESTKVFASHPSLDPKPRPGSQIQFVKVKNCLKKSHFWKSSKKLFIFPEESQFDSIMVPHNPRPGRVRIAGHFRGPPPASILKSLGFWDPILAYFDHLDISRHLLEEPWPLGLCGLVGVMPGRCASYLISWSLGPLCVVEI